MKNFIKIVAIILFLSVVGFIACSMTGCSEAAKVNHNLRKSADAFNISRQITVFNTRTDTVLFQMTGLMSLSNDEANELVVTVETDENVYKKHYIYLSDDVTYVMEDVSGQFTNKYFYELNINPAVIAPLVQPTIID